MPYKKHFSLFLDNPFILLYSLRFSSYYQNVCAVRLDWAYTGGGGGGDFWGKIATPPPPGFWVKKI